MFTKEPLLKILPAPDKWEVRAPGEWESPELTFVLPEGWITDLASIPRAIRFLLNRNGRSRYPALLHDWLYNTQIVTREFADEMFRRALIAYGMTPCQARIYWLGVRTGGWLVWRRRLGRGGGLQRDDFTTERAFLSGRSAAADLRVRELLNAHRS